MVISLNGMIARKDNSEDFVSEKNWSTLVSLTKKSGCLIWGSKTYQIVKTWEKKYLDELSDVTKIIVSSKDEALGGEKVFLVHSPSEAILKAEELGFSDIILSGGSTLNAGFMETKNIDEVIFNVEPYLLGEGIPVFKEASFESKLHFFDFKKLEDGILQLHYKVVK
jgi:dihydrofolate reductase